jgi:hypothetical protein
MPKRTAKLASAAVVSLFTGILFATTSHGETIGSERCLSAPKGETPTDYHWYYRVDHTTKRNCWYLRQEGSSLSQTTPRNIRPQAETSVSRTQPSPVEAHAEVRARSSQDNAASFPVLAAAPKETPQVLFSTENAPLAIVASRWPDLPPASSMPAPQQATTRVAGDLSRETSRLSPAAATLAPLAIAASAVPGEPGTIRNLIAATLGALTLAGAAAMLMSRRSHAPRLRRGDIYYTQRPIWETTDDTRIVLSTDPGSDSRDYRRRFAREMEESTTAPDRTAGLFSRSAGRRTV